MNGVETAPTAGLAMRNAYKWHHTAKVLIHQVGMQITINKSKQCWVSEDLAELAGQYIGI